MEIKQLNNIFKFFNDLSSQIIRKIKEIGKEQQKIIQSSSRDIQKAIEDKKIELLPVQELVKPLQKAIEGLDISPKIEFPKFPEFPEFPKFPEMPEFPKEISIKEAVEITDTLTKIVEEIREKDLKVDLTVIEKGLWNLQDRLSQEISEIRKAIPIIPELPMEEGRVMTILPERQVAKISGGGGSSGIFPIFVKDPTIYNVSMASANGEYSQTLPSNTKKLDIKLRALNSVLKISFTITESGTKYIQIPYGASLHLENINLTGKTIYFQSPVDNQVAEILCWT